MKVLYTVIICIICAFQANAQKHFSEGIIYYKDGQSQAGYIQNGNWDITPREIVFKKDFSSNEIIKFTPQDIDGFEVIGRRFDKLSHEVDLSPFKISQFTAGKARKTESRLFFVERLLEGDMILFHYRDEDEKSHYFVQSPNAEILYLKNSYFLRQDEKTYRYFLASANEYLEQLQERFPDCLKISSENETVAFTKDELTQLLEQVAVCKGWGVKRREFTFKLFRFRPHLTIGVAQSKLIFLNGNLTGNPYYNLADFPISISPLLGFGGRMEILRIDHLSLEFDVLYRMLDWTGGFYKEEYGGGNYRDVFIDYKMQNIRINTSIRKGWTVGAFALVPFLRVGGFMGKYFAMDGEINYSLVVQGVNYDQNSETPYGVNPNGAYDLGYVVGAGLGIKSFALEARMERSSGFSNSWAGSVNSIRCFSLVGQYRF